VSDGVDLKFTVGPAFVLPDLTGAGSVARMQATPPQELRETLYDTVDRRLARWGITLRHRAGEADRPPWALGLPASNHGLIEEDGGPDVIPQRLADLVTAHVRSRPLGVAATVATQRSGWRLLAFDGQLIAALTTDHVLVMDHEEVRAQFSELDLVAGRATPLDLEAVSTRLLAAGATGAPPIPAAIRALGPTAGNPPDVVLREFQPEDAAGWAVRSAMADALLRILRHDPGTRLGDDEALHQLRVGIRRLRSDLRTLRSLTSPDWAPGLDADLRRLASLLGAVRDLDVLLTLLVSNHADLMGPLAPMLDDLRHRHAVARAALLEELRSDRYVQVLERLVVLARDPDLTEAALEPAGTVLPILAAKSWRRVRRRVKDIRDRSQPTDTELHAVRIAAKRARYAAELASRGLPPDQADEAIAFAAAVADLQDVLGRHQDAVVAIRETHAAALAHENDLELVVAAGRLMERELQAAREERGRFAETWRAASRRRQWRWMAA
jgi:CHAD domain-containing protein